MRKCKQRYQPYIIRYIRGSRVLDDSATTLEIAKAKIAARAAKRHNKGEYAEVRYIGFSDGEPSLMFSRQY